MVKGPRELEYVPDPESDHFQVNVVEWTKNGQPVTARTERGDLMSIPAAIVYIGTKLNVAFGQGERIFRWPYRETWARVRNGSAEPVTVGLN